MKSALHAGTSVDEVQELIVRAEEILESLERLGDVRVYTLRDRFRNSVMAARSRMLSAQELPASQPGSHVAVTFPKHIALAALAGMTLGLLITLPAMRQH